MMAMMMAHTTYFGATHVFRAIQAATVAKNGIMDTRTDHRAC
jgi:hypothetical protein